MFPKHFTCRFCKDEIELDDNELGLVEVVCPSCRTPLLWADVIPMRISLLTRMESMILDQLIMGIIALGFDVPAMIYSVTHEKDVYSRLTASDLTNYGLWMYLGLVGYAMYFCKDVIEGRSPAKRVLKLAVVDSSTGKPATPIQTLIRNAFSVFWPIEVVVTLFNPPQRIGDFVAGTIVVPFESSTAETSHRNYRQILISFALAYIVMLLFWEFMTRVVAG